MNDAGRLLIGLGLLLLVAGAIMVLLGRVGLPLGRLPGDFSWRGKHTTVYFPLGTCILISVALSLVFWILGRLHK
jgi:ribose/xylose/arabinose/galactoside ABC-type transport system permease subunit